MKKDFLQIKFETKEEFDKIAHELLNNYAIENHESLFRLTEIEFYWNSPKHKDASTYHRKYVDPNHGDWFFHHSGVDIALKNEKLDDYGGILIRGVYSIKEQKHYKGPMICAMKLFSGTSAFSESIKTKIVEHKFDKKGIVEKPRLGLGNNAIKSGTNLFDYNYSINPKGYLIFLKTVK